jgi:hypothetical protein
VSGSGQRDSLEVVESQGSQQILRKYGFSDRGLEEVLDAHSLRRRRWS